MLFFFTNQYNNEIMEVQMLSQLLTYMDSNNPTIDLSLNMIDYSVYMTLLIEYPNHIPIPMYSIPM